MKPKWLKRTVPQMIECEMCDNLYTHNSVEYRKRKGERAHDPAIDGEFDYHFEFKCPKCGEFNTNDNH